MRRIALAVAATTALSIAALGAATQSASAADMHYKAPHVDPYKWTGFYVGYNVGYGWGKVDMTNRGPDIFFAPVGGTDSLSPKGWLGGGQIGYNWQTGAIVFGVEGMLDFASLKQSKASIFFPADDIWEAKVTALYSITGRLGYAVGPALPYIKGGFAGGRVKTSMDCPACPEKAESTNWHSGWTIGGGLEYMLSRNWTLGIEYDHYALSSKDVSVRDTAGFIENWTVKPRINAIALRANFKF
jgi:outer membrane immunogenic protein